MSSATCVDRVRETGELWFRAPMWIAFIVGIALLHALAPGETNWQLMAWYSAILILGTTVANSPLTFFTGQGATLLQSLDYLVRGTPTPRPELPDATAEDRRRSEVGFWTLMPSAFITWIFAKSINNSALYGTRWGMLGGVVYAGWYMSFPAAAIFGYFLRTRHGFGSLPTAIEKCYGSSATVLFGLIVLYRLWNEIWSNTVVVAGFYSETEGTGQWWAACILSAAVPAVFVLMGGMRSSLVTDVLMAFLGLLFLFVILGIIGAEMPGGVAALWRWEPPGGWWPGVGTALGSSLLQGCVSYPFHDAVLTDRAFLSRPRTMLAAFMTGGAIAGVFIILFASIGVYGSYALGRLSFYASAPVARALGPTAFAFINLVMMTSSMSTIDSTYGSVSKLIGLEFCGWFTLPGDKRESRGPLRPTDIDNVGWAHVAAARCAIVFLAIVGTLYVLIDTSTINATEVSGTMVMGLGPPIWMLLAWKFNSAPGSGDGWQRAPLMFALPYATGVFFGVVYNTQAVGSPEEKARAVAMMAPFRMGEGSFTTFLGWNVLGHALCFVACLLGFAIHQTVWRLGAVDPPPSVEHPVTGERIVRPGFEGVFDDATAHTGQPTKLKPVSIVA
ncbi:hypothetical protein KFE25_007632 [Diacronema lutheri]|uniref:Uncharacterized protein n=2 Tax=Diacronema lutheri TaxID=2081491 RepID=A0A8J5Y0K7_DIALT|nr:hypothetical protein KFE25_007632 [Diacronema lutheri]